MFVRDRDTCRLREFRKARVKAFRRRVTALDRGPERIKYYQGIHAMEAFMVYCPECESDLDIEEDEVDEGEVVSCPECGTDFEIVTVNPIELKPVDEEEDEEDEEEDEESEDGDL
jgi:alpha-aminoadipate carrier protein LysW